MEHPHPTSRPPHLPLHLPQRPLPEKPLLISANDPTHYLTHSTYRLYSQRLALGLQRAGLQPGDRVLLFSGNSIFFPVVLMGVIMAGGIFTGANPGYVARELAYQLQDSGATFLITAEASLATALEAADAVGMRHDRIFVFNDNETDEASGPNVQQDRPKGVRHWSHLLAPASSARIFAWEALTTPSQTSRTIALNYSSGTTGPPKGVEITHHNYVSNTAQTVALARLAPDFEAMNARARWLCFLPMYHAMAQTIFCVAAPLRGIPVYVMPKFDFLGMLEAVQKFRITDLILVPPVVVALAKHPAARKFDLSSVERVGSGAAPLGREVCEELERLWPPGKINVKQGWGMTEGTCTVLSWNPEERSESFSVGELVANCEARLVDDNGNEVGPGERGELWVRAPNVMKGYWKRPEATRETVTPDGWLKTGDIAYADAQGKFFIVDRKKELIKVKGNQVAPAELEALLLEHPAVADAAVIGVTINGEELPRAYIVLKQGTQATEKEIQDFMKGKVSRTKRLDGGVRFVDVIPKNPSGKILRKMLREQAKAEVGDSEARAVKL
ncbi:hypothetical protein H2199_006805 [Coniosporium tulheliwenetii]|uniref:Uncharacterized protein n=1 Tax=Coniosporium tulheliwenetii TaxID=3383036 RepID=A0ACC2YUK2_9PEZI|nr:hypothetical protein H2199_006805 [Cladosporium sp. JES 115]